MDIDDLASYCKRRGLVFPTSEIYGSVAGFYDYGPVGVEMDLNIKNLWWKSFVRSREDVVGINGCIITNPKVWEASGHVSSFNDPLTECRTCKKRWRADHVIEDALNKPMDGVGLSELSNLIINNKLKCPKCKGDLGEARAFSQMLSTSVGPVEGNISYLRPETCQSIFADYKNVMDSTRMKPPFGIAQIGKAFRNEISPRGFLFRMREFEQAEIEFFAKESQANDCPEYNLIKNFSLNVLDENMQKKGDNNAKIMSVEDCVKNKVFPSKWFAYWVANFYKWYLILGVKENNLRIRQHVSEELSHYSGGTVDIEYKFPMGFKELQGFANRTNYDLTQHQKFSGEKLDYFDESTGKRELLHVVVEPSVGLTRLFLMLLFECLVEEKERLVLKIDPRVSAYKVAIFPLVKKDLTVKARQVFKDLSQSFNCFYDESGSIGRRYRRQDEIGTPYCITIDFDTLKDNTVTLRERDSMKQERVKIEDLKKIIESKL